MVWSNFLNKNVKIIFEDGENHYSKKIGKLIEVNPSHIVIESNGGVEALSLLKILRMEVNVD